MARARGAARGSRKWRAWACPVREVALLLVLALHAC